MSLLFPLIEKAVLVRLSITIAYPLISALKRLAGTCGAVIRDERYAEKAFLILELPADTQKRFEASLAALTKGDVDITLEKLDG
jgi:putative IMPACT (imprinted ancient) family translation regulator